MFSGLFKHGPLAAKPKPPRTATPTAAKQAASGVGSNGKGEVKGKKSQQKRQPEQKQQQPKARSEGQAPEPKAAKRKQSGVPGSTAPAGGIPMTEEEVARFQNWKYEQTGQSPDIKKRKQIGKDETEQQKGASSAAEAPRSKQAKKRMRLRQQREAQPQQNQKHKPPGRPDAAPVAPPSINSSAVKMGGAVGKAAARLQGSRFRMLNETLYTVTGDEAKKLYDKDPSLAVAYHEGFREQASKWPRNPLDDVIKWLAKEVSPDKVIGDFGCGDARLALELKGRTVHSFDLVQINERVTPCNLAAVPLDDQTIDVAVFCLALMGTDWPSFLEEAHRCLRLGGLLHIAEVESRMSDIDAMTSTVEAIGFSKLFVKHDKFFLEMRFRKDVKSGGGKKKSRGAGKGHGAIDAGAVLGACIYKRR